MKTPMMFSQTFELVTDESAEQGEAEETGFDWKDVPYTFGELVRMIKSDYCSAEPSDYPSTNPRWITARGGQDMTDGSYRSISLHPANDRAARYWSRALKLSGVL